MRRPAALSLALLLLLSGAVGAQEASPTTTPSAPPPPTAVVDVDGEVFRIELTAPGARDGAIALLRGTSGANIPVGTIVRDDPGPNAPWSWHIDPASLTWAEATIEVCDGRPTQIEDGVLGIDRFCPWSARLLGVEHDPDGLVGWTSYGTDLPVEATGGTSREDRTFARRLLLADDGSYTLHLRTGPNLDLTVSGCPASIQLLSAVDRSPAPGSVDPFPTIQPDDTTALTWPDLPMGAYDLWVSLDCAWSIRFDRTGSSSAS
jgi:hypothetical protein